VNFKVEGLCYATREQVDTVARRFARRYGRDIAVYDAADKLLYYVTTTGRKIYPDGKPKK
jgi:hypothetical protein